MVKVEVKQPEGVVVNITLPDEESIKEFICVIDDGFRKAADDRFDEGIDSYEASELEIQLERLMERLEEEIYLNLVT